VFTRGELRLLAEVPAVLEEIKSWVRLGDGHTVDKTGPGRCYDTGAV
jgi:hypothetical protein